MIETALRNLEVAVRYADIFDARGRFTGVVWDCEPAPEVYESADHLDGKLHSVDWPNLHGPRGEDRETVERCAALLREWESDLDDLEVLRDGDGYAVFCRRFVPEVSG